MPSESGIRWNKVPNHENEERQPEACEPSSLCPLSHSRIQELRLKGCGCKSDLNFEEPWLSISSKSNVCDS